MAISRQSRSFGPPDHLIIPLAQRHARGQVFAKTAGQTAHADGFRMLMICPFKSILDDAHRIVASGGL
jgi:hypothetical protein